MSTEFEGQVAAIAALHDPTRRALYRYVVQHCEAVSREQAASAVGVQRALAAFHLDKLAHQGLLEFEFRRVTGRSGPGAGRPSKLYRRSNRQIDLSLPARGYGLAGRLLAAAIDASGSSHRNVREELEHAAYELGREMARQALALAGDQTSTAAAREALLEVLREHGFEPRTVADGIVLANCPFHALAEQFTDLVCGMNLYLLEGVRSGIDLGHRQLQPSLQPETGLCCVRFCSARP